MFANLTPVTQKIGMNIILKIEKIAFRQIAIGLNNLAQPKNDKLYFYAIVFHFYLCAFFKE